MKKEQTENKWDNLIKAIKCYNESINESFKTDSDADLFNTFYEVMNAVLNYESTSSSKISFVLDQNIISNGFHLIKGVKLTDRKQTYIFDDIDEYLKANNY